MANTKKQTVKVEIPETSTIEETKQVKNKPFSKKKIILLCLFAVISLVVIGLTIRFVLDIKWDTLFSSISNGFAARIGILWFFLLVFYGVWTIPATYVPNMCRLIKLGYKISQAEYWLLGLTSAFFRTITPFFMGESFTLIWMKVNGVPTYRLTSIMFSNTLFWQVIQFAITLPSFIVVAVHRGVMFATTEGQVAFWFLVTGIIIDLISILFMFLLCWSRKMHYGMSRIFNWFKKVLHMKYHTKEETKKKYQEKAVIKQDFIAYMKDWKTTLIIFTFLVLAECMTYFSISWSMYFVQNVHLSSGLQYKVMFDFGWTFHSANVTFTTNRLNFLVPNGEGTIEFFLRTYLKALSSWNFVPLHGSPVPTEAMKNDLIKNVVDNSIIVWRFMGTAVPALVGIGGLIGWIVKHKPAKAKPAKPNANVISK